MHLWQVEVKNKLLNDLGDFLGIEKVEAKGSVLELEQLDVFSDVDLEVYLRNDEVIGLEKFFEIITDHCGPIFGYETHQQEKNDVIRICFENGWRLDLTIYYRERTAIQVKADSPAATLTKVINEFWFLASMVLVKLGRRDFLIASHLALELCQMNIVILMLIRDHEKKTNIHRFGDGEDVLMLQRMAQLNENGEKHENETVANILNILFEAAQVMDETVATLDIDDIKRTENLRMLQKKWFLSSESNRI